MFFGGIALIGGVAFARPDPAVRAKASRDYWRAQYVREHALRKRIERRQGVRVRGLRAQVRADRRLITDVRVAYVHRSSSLEAIRLASIVYQQSYGDMLRVARCESPGLNPTLVNAEPVGREHATSLFQFLRSTFLTTPFARMNWLSPYVSSMAAGWMWQHGRRGEWACR